MNETWYSDRLIYHIYSTKISPRPLSRENGGGVTPHLYLTLASTLQVSIAEVEWSYDHDLDPFNLRKICFILCSDSLSISSLTLTSFLTDKCEISAVIIDQLFHYRLSHISCPIESNKHQQLIRHRFWDTLYQVWKNLGETSWAVSFLSLSCYI